jgi:hypothetical protein
LMKSANRRMHEGGRVTSQHDGSPLGLGRPERPKATARAARGRRQGTPDSDRQGDGPSLGRGCVPRPYPPLWRRQTSLGEEEVRRDPTYLRGLPISEALEAPIDPGYVPQTPLDRVLHNETKAYCALTFGDLLYDWVRIEPHVLEAVDFVRVADLADIFAFARCADSLQTLSDAARLGNVTQLQGYVAERVAAGMLRAQGAEVEIPASPSQPGYDLIVNGQHCQIKCLDDRSGVDAHLGRYPDVPALVNEELAEHFAEDDRVMALPGLNQGYGRIWGMR